MKGDRCLSAIRSSRLHGDEEIRGQRYATIPQPFKLFNSCADECLTGEEDKVEEKGWNCLFP